MKVQLIKSENSLIKGYKPVYYSSSIKLQNLSPLSNNECELILANNILDEFNIKESPEIIASLISKLRINGILIVGGTDIRLFCKSIINGLLDEANASEMIGAVNSMSNVENTVKILQSLNLKIQSSQITGNHYEITAVRN